MKKRLAVLAVLTLLLSFSDYNTKAAAADNDFSENRNDVKSSYINGDVNSDGDLTVSDAVLLQKWILGVNDAVFSNYKAADLCEDEMIDVFDFIALKKELLSDDSEYSALKINEVCSSNSSCYYDKLGNTPDWIEIYNSSDTAIDMGGIGLSDSKKNKYKFVFPKNTIIEPYGCLLVICSDTVCDEALYAPFNISSSGETIYLTEPEEKSGNLIDKVKVPSLETDEAYGRYADGTFTVLVPTPDSANDLSEPVLHISKPVFSKESGFYSDEFMLSLSSSDNYRIFYTTDGSNPITSDTAKVYDKPIRMYDNTSDKNRFINRICNDEKVNNPDFEDVDKGFVIRAVSQNEHGEFSRIVTNSYFVGKTADFYNNMKVVSMAIDEKDLFDSEKGIYSDNNLFGSGIEWERPANIQVFEKSCPVYSDNIGVRLAGNASREYFQKSFTFYARKTYGKGKMHYQWIEDLKDINGNEINDFDKITLRNNSEDWDYLKMRNYILQDLVSNRNLTLQGQEYCVLFINGEFWGLYTITEKYDENYIESHYNISKNDCTYYKIWNDVKGSEEIMDEYKDFFEWAKTADMKNESNYQRVCDTIDIQSLMEYITFQTYICNCDWMSGEEGNISNNWAMWRSNSVDKNEKYHDGKWRFMIYDTDRSTGLADLNTTDYSYDLLNKMDRTGLFLNISNVFYNLMNNDSFRNSFYKTYMEMIENDFEASEVKDRILKISELTKEASCKSNRCFSDTSADDNYNEYLDTFIDFFLNRPKYAEKYLNMLISEYTS